MSRTNILVIGAGYVGLSTAVLLSQNNDVCIIDTDPIKVNMLKSKRIPFKDSYESVFNSSINKIAIYDKYDHAMLKNVSHVFIAVPTDFDESTGKFRISIIQDVLEEIDSIIGNTNVDIIIKSTVPIGFTESQNKKFKTNRIYFCPEFLREGHAIRDSFCPSRLIIGGNNINSTKIRSLISGNLELNPKTYICNPTEAESIKLFSNSFLALRVSFFNELDTFANENNLNSELIIAGVCEDKRIGNLHNNPSFGFGGYCLPKDTKQLEANFMDIPQVLISSIIKSNELRKQYIAQSIINMNPKKIGIFRLTMKKGSDNFKGSVTLDVLNILKDISNVNMVIYEPLINSSEFMGCKVIKELDEFKSSCDLILANRNSSKLDDVSNKIFTRDIFRIN